MLLLPADRCEGRPLESPEAERSERPDMSALIFSRMRGESDCRLASCAKTDDEMWLCLGDIPK